MKSAVKMFGIIALVAVIGFSMTACKTDGDGDAGTPYTIYKGSGYISSYDRDGIYALKIFGDNTYELLRDYVEEGNSVSYERMSSGIVVQKLDTTYYLKPSNSAVQFTATVSPAGLVELIGTIYDSNGSPIIFPTTLTPTGVGTGIDKGGGAKEDPIDNGGIEEKPICHCNGNRYACNCESNGYSCECDVCEEPDW